MRRLGQSLVIVVLVGLIAWASSFAPSVLRDLGENNADGLFGADRQLVYPLDNTRPTRFIFSTPQSKVRIITHAEISPNAALAVDQRYRYDVIIEARDTEGDVLERRKLSFATRLLMIQGRDKRSVSSVSYEENDVVPTAADITFVDLPRPAAALYITSPSHNTGVSGVAARVYERMPISEQRLRTAWARLSPADRIELTRDSALPAAMLTDAERRRLIQNRWSPVGPQGVFGRDYRTRTLFVREGGTTAAAPDVNNEARIGRHGATEYAATPGEPIVFAVRHVGDSATPFRLTIRTPRLGDVSVRYELRNALGAASHAGALKLLKSASGDQLDGIALAAPNTFYFNLSVGMSTLAVVANGPVVVTAANRPPDIVPTTLVPVPQGDTIAGPNWYPIAALAGGTPVMLQSGPEAPAAVDTADDDRSWQGLDPVNSPLSRDFYVPAGANAAPSDVFTPVKVGEQTLQFVQSDNSDTSSPRLLYLQGRRATASLAGTVDAAQWFDERVASLSGKLPLAALTPGQHRVAIMPNAGARLFMSHIAPNPGSLRERRFSQLEDGRARFIVVKSTKDTELVAINLLTKPGVGGVVNVSIEGPTSGVGPHTGWTPRKRTFVVAPGLADPRVVGVGQPGAFAAERRLLVPLRADLPPGRYDIAIQFSKAAGYVHLNHRILQATDRRDLFVEEESGS